MLKRIYLIASVFAIFITACSEKDIPVPINNATYDAAKALLGNTSAVTYTDESAFVASLSTYGFKNPSQLNLNRIGTSSGYTSVYGFNIPADRQVKGFKWNTGDQDTKEWRPQGIAGFTWGSKNYILVTWYGIGPGDIAGINNQHKGVRIALVDITNMSAITYRHIILVQNKANMSNSALYDASNPYTQGDLFCPVTIHAGGVAYYNQKIYVVDTGLGMRVFDLNKFLSVSADDPSGNTIGKQSDGTLKAFGYAYVLPETGYYTLTGTSPHSCVELGTGATSTDLRLWTGQYLASGTPKVFGFPINTSGTITGTPSTINPKDDTGTPVFRVQGVYRRGTQTFMTTTGNSSYLGSTARLVRHNDGTTAGSRYRWPHGAEDFYYENATGYLWNLTEYETAKYGTQNRCVFAVRLSDYD